VKAETVGKWRKRFEKFRMAGLTDAQGAAGPAVSIMTKSQRSSTKRFSQSLKDATHWPTTLMAKETGINAMAISSIWRAFGLKPHRLEALELPTDTHFLA